jgi:hypothetical protein
MSTLFGSSVAMSVSSSSENGVNSMIRKFERNFDENVFTFAEKP